MPVSCYDAWGGDVPCDDVPVLELMPAYEMNKNVQGDLTTAGDPETVWRYYDETPGSHLPAGMGDNSGEVADGSARTLIRKRSVSQEDRSKR